MTTDPQAKSRFLRHKRRYIRVFGRGPLSDHDLETAGRIEFGKRWAGVYDQATYRPKKGTYAVLNTSYAPQSPGVHWLASYTTPAGITYLYDSYGRKTSRVVPRTWKNILQGGGRLGAMPDFDAEQKGDSAVCGHMCLAWLATVKELGIRRASTV